MRICLALLISAPGAPLPAFAQAPSGGKPLATVNLITFGGGYARPA